MLRATALWAVFLMAGASIAPSTANAQSLVEVVDSCLPLPTPAELLRSERISADAKARRTAQIQLLLSRIGFCERNAEALTRLGIALNTVDRSDEALEHLERALLLRPDEPFALLGFARALATLGDRAAAQELLESASAWAAPAAQRGVWLEERQALLAIINPSPAQRMMGMARWRVPFTDQRAWASQWTMGVGHESNGLGAPSAQSLTLTLGGLPGGEVVRVTVPLDAASRPQGAAYGLIQARVHQVRHWESSSQQWRWDAMAVARHRSTEAGVPGSLTQAEVLSELETAPKPGGSEARPQGLQRLYLQGGANALRSATGVRYASSSVGGGWHAAWSTPWRADCRLKLGGEYQARRFLSNAVLDGNYAGATTSLRCVSNPVEGGDSTGNLPQWISLHWRKGSDRPVQAQRAGGQQAQSVWRLGLGGGWWSMDAEHAVQNDAAAYSPLIEQGAVRRLTRQSVRLETWMTIPKFPFQVVLSAEASKQRSALTLFNSENQGVFLGVRVAH